MKLKFEKFFIFSLFLSLSYLINYNFALSESEDFPISSVVEKQREENQEDLLRYTKAVILAKAKAACYNLGKEKLPALDEEGLFLTKRAECISSQCYQCINDTKNETYNKEIFDGRKDGNGYGFIKSSRPSPIPVFHCSERNQSKAAFQVHFRWQYAQNHSLTLQNLARFEPDAVPRIFIVEQAINGTWDTAKINLTEYWFISISIPDFTSLKIRITAVAPALVYDPVELSETVDLIDTNFRGKGTPRNLRVVKIRQNANETLTPDLEYVVHWESGSGLNTTCRSSVWILYDDDANKTESKEPYHAFWVVLNNKAMEFNQSYAVKVMEKSDNQVLGYPESKKAELTLTVPPCLDFFGRDFKFCAPPPPLNLKVKSNTQSGILWISWDHPPYSNSTNRIESFMVKAQHITKQFSSNTGYTTGTTGLVMTEFPLKNTFHQETIPGNKSNTEIRNVTIKGAIQISVQARTLGGISQELSKIIHIPPGEHVKISNQILQVDIQTGLEDKIWVIVIMVGALFSVGFVLCICCLKNYREKLRRKKQRDIHFQNLDKESPRKNYARSPSKWEIDSGCLTFGDVIGEGNFGLVRKAILYKDGKKLTVAVKTLRDGGDAKDDSSKFWEEFDILRNLEPHIHVVGLVGIVKTHGPALVVEYCQGGDLKTHLRKAYQARMTRTTQHLSVSATSSCEIVSVGGSKVRMSMVTNEAYFVKTQEDTIHDEISELDLLSYARQIAFGMEFLSSNKILHRDLAARNVLVSGINRTIKIADFGLSRDVYEKNWYKKNSNGKIPIKWLAIECLLQELYTTKSDVWSYGILLWEIVTYGGIPYPGIENTKVFDLLKSGYRMEQPENCLDELYQIMRQCWQEQSEYRPDFFTIRTKLDELIENSSSVTYMNLNSKYTSEDDCSCQHSIIENPLADY